MTGNSLPSSEDRRPTVLMLTPYYAPAYCAGGPIRTLVGLTERLGDRFRFLVLTSNGDLATARPLPVAPNRLQRVGKADVCYLSPDQQRLPAMARVLRSLRYDVMHLDGCFPPAFSVGPMLLRRFGYIPRRPAIVAPRGEFAPGALDVGGWRKRWKKRVFRRAADLLGLYRGVLWQASSRFEAEDIRRMYPRAAVRVAPDLAADMDTVVDKLPKEPGKARFACLTRISAEKNLAFAIETLGRLQGQVEFDLYGPQHDPSYWAQCRSRMEGLRDNVRITYHGPLERSAVSRALSSTQFFYLPTRGENFGHSIVEAMGHGRPVIISNRTPWRDLEGAHAGWDLPLEDADTFVRVLQRCVDMGPQEYARFSQGSREYVKSRVNSEEAVAQNIALFLHALALGDEPQRRHMHAGDL